MNLLKRAFLAVAFVWLCVLLNACLSVKFGQPLVIDGLDSLELGKSVHSDILLALGTPRGNGSARLSAFPESRDILFYEFLKSGISKIELEFLLVFMRDERYDGYLWFASSDRMNMKGVMGHFPEVGPLEESFVRGQTSRENVIARLGEASGSGAAILPPKHLMQDVLFYQDMEMTNMEKVGEVFQMDMRQRILLVLFTEDTYDGFLWYSNAGLAEGKL